LEVEVSSNESEQEDSLDNDEPEDAYANEPLADGNWLARYGAERQKAPELHGLTSVATCMGVEEEACSRLLLRCFAIASTSEL